MMTIPTPPVKTIPWYAGIPECCACFAAHMNERKKEGKNMMTKLSKKERKNYDNS